MTRTTLTIPLSIQRLLAFGLIAALSVSAVPTPAEAAMVRIYLTSGTTWSVPADWNSSNNTIEVIGGGGGGGGMTSGATRAGSGGGGGGYSKAVNVTLTPSTNVTYAVGTGGTGGQISAGGTGGDTYLCNSTSNCASISGSAVVVGAKGGGGAANNTGGTPGSGGAAASGVGSVKYSGGSGVIGVVGVSSGGGGGAAGPRGNGENASTVGTGTAFGRGGQGSAGYGGAGGALGSAGSAGTEWGSVGSGGGGGSRNSDNNTSGHGGGLYGAGGGGAYSTGNNLSGGNGAQGVVVITYFPTGGFGVTFGSNARFLSNLDIRGNVSKGSGTFVIDHPQDPARKILYHSFLESPDAKNMYDGIAELDENGEVVIELPSYFEALNKDFRYQFFPLEQAMPDLHIKEKVKDNKFTIGGGEAGGKISWQITGNRHDPYIEAKPIIVEVIKGPDELVDRGECIFEPACDVQ